MGRAFFIIPKQLENALIMAKHFLGRFFIELNAHSHSMVGGNEKPAQKGRPEKGVFRLFGSITILWALCGEQALAKSPNAFEFKLKNGLQVVVLQKNMPLVAHLIFYPVGSADDPYGKTGLAHYLEHMMFKGPQHSASAQMTEAVEALGGLQNAMTTYDFTLYYNIIASNHLKKVMAFEAARMADLKVETSGAETELNVIFEERRMRFENNPFGEFFTLLMGRFFQYHPYRNPPIGWEGDLKPLKGEDVRNFHQTHYGPHGGVLVLVGDININEAKSLADRYYSPITPKKSPPRLWLSEPDHGQVATTIKFRSPFISHPHWVRLYPMPILNEGKVYESTLLSLVDHLLTVDPWGDLFNTLVKVKKLATVINVNSTSPSRGPGVVYISGEPVPGVSIETLEAAVLEAINTVAFRGFSEEDLQKAKDQILIQRAFDGDSLLGEASFYGEHLIRGASFQDIQNRDALLQGITLSEINGFLKTLLTSTYHLTGHLLAQGDLTQ